MKTSELVIGSIYAQCRRRDMYETDTYAVMVLDTKLWRMGNEWTDGPEGGRVKKFSFRPAPKGLRAHEGDYRNDYRATGVPVLKLDTSAYRWNSTIRDEMALVDTADSILRKAAEQLGIEQASDAEGFHDSRSTTVAVTMRDGSKGGVRVVLDTVLPQTVQGAWTSYLKERDRLLQVAQEQAIRKAKEADLRRTAQSGIKARLDALLGEEKSSPWSSTENRFDVRPSGKDFTITEETLLRLLALAEKGSEQ